MIIPQTDLNQWILKYPRLSEDLNKKCKCGEIFKNFKPYLTKKYAGIMADKCQCGRNGILIFVHRNSKIENEFWKSFNN